jgi:hypothetical protein
MSRPPAPTGGKAGNRLPGFGPWSQPIRGGDQGSIRGGDQGSIRGPGCDAQLQGVSHRPRGGERGFDSPYGSIPGRSPMGPRVRRSGRGSKGWAAGQRMQAGRAPGGSVRAAARRGQRRGQRRPKWTRWDILCLGDLLAISMGLPRRPQNRGYSRSLLRPQRC